MYDVFISYVLGNEGTVRRIFEDLIRSGITTWEFRSCVKFDVNFIEEFKKQINDAKVFLLIDSNESRKGEYVKVEVAHALDQKKIITICRIEEFISEPALFEWQDYIIRFNLWEKKYKESIKDLCRHLGKEFIPAFSDPMDDDFLKEMSEIKMKEADMEAGSWKKLYTLYEEFRDELGSEMAEVKLKTLLADSKKYNTPLITPYLVLGDLYAKKKQHVQAKTIYKEASNLFQSDPRTYAGVAGASYFLSEYSEAAEAYSACFDLLLKTENRKHREHIVQVAHNLLQSMLEGNIETDFIQRINQIPENDRHTQHIESLKGKYYLYHKNYRQATIHFENAYAEFIQQKDAMTSGNATYLIVLTLDLATAYGHERSFMRRKEVLNEGVSFIESDWRHINDPSLRQLLPELFRLLAETFLYGEHNEGAAIHCYEKAAEYGENIKYYAELALLLAKLSPSKLQAVLEKADSFRPKRSQATKEEYYYTGLYYFLKGKMELAKEYYSDSDMHSWPFYADLI